MSGIQAPAGNAARNMKGERVRVLLWAQPGVRPPLERALGTMGNVDLVSVGSGDEAVAAVDGAEILVMPVFHYNDRLASAVRKSASIKWMQLLTVGYDRLTPESAPDGVLISTAGDALAPAIADHAMALLLGVWRNLPENLMNQRDEKWDRSPYERSTGLDGRTIAVFGFGAIGQAVAKRVRGFDCEVVGINTSGTSHPLAHRMYRSENLHSALEGCDAVVIAAALNDSTRYAFNEQAFQAMKRGAVLVNVARGQIVSTQALVGALAEGQLAGAGLDVVDPEPLPPGHPLWSAANVIITPHIAAGGAANSLARTVANNIGRYAAGETPNFLIEV